MFAAKLKVKLLVVVALTVLIAGAMFATGPDEAGPGGGVRTSEGVR
jgi:hypothetical protein